ncbi:MAG: hypothetical protein U0361_13755 [Nitrospiraceae bacterium]
MEGGQGPADQHQPGSGAAAGPGPFHPRRGEVGEGCEPHSPSGDIKAGNLDYNVFTNTQFKTVEPIADVVVKIDARGNPVRIRDPALRRTPRYPDQHRAHRRQALRLSAGNKQPTANTEGRVGRASPRLYPNDRHLAGVQSDFFDQSVYIRQAFKT